MTTPTKGDAARLTQLNPKQEQPGTTGSVEAPPTAQPDPQPKDDGSDLFRIVPELAGAYRKVIDARMERKAHAGSESWAFYAGMETAAMETAMWKALRLLAEERREQQ